MRIVVLAGTSLDGFQAGALEPLTSSAEHHVVGCAIDGRPGKSLRQRLRDNLARGRGGYVLVMLATLPLRSREPEQATRAWCERHGIAVIETQDPYGRPTLDQIHALAPDVMVLIGGFGIVKQPLIDLAPRGILSYHHGDMRRYRGQPPGLWELYDGEPAMGVTVQRLNASLDAGEPIVELTVPIEPTDTVARLRARALTTSIPMLHEAVKQLADPDRVPQTIDRFGPVYTLPNLRQWLLLNGRIAVRRLRAR